MGSTISKVVDVASKAIPTVLKAVEDPLGAVGDLLPQAEGLLKKGFEIFTGDSTPSSKGAEVVLPQEAPPELHRAAKALSERADHPERKRSKLLTVLEHLMDFLESQEL
jgi:hypothetical protein